MIDIIQLLPDNLANQIAAGEVIQRPSSAVKELMENAIDAGATQVQLHLMDAGKSVLQVIDNGKGMSETDARMAFERHATSKIKSIDDLFSIRTLGFRGEALASIAAVAQVEMKTKRKEDNLGTYIEIENSTVQIQEPCMCAVGTSITVKNLFFNVPARRNFLKANPVEMRHIVDEFVRIAIAFPNILFSLHTNKQELFHFSAGNLKQRVIQVLGNNYLTKLVTVREETDYLVIYGFVGKPDTAKKTRGDQYFFVNNRFIKSPYLNHAVSQAFQDIIPKDSYPGYVLFIDLDPSEIDINVHPTKQEIKFEDEKIVYAFVQSAVKHSLAQFSIAPSLDFSLNRDIQGLDAIQVPATEKSKETTAQSPIYQNFTQKNQSHFIERSSTQDNLTNWKSFFQQRPEIAQPPQQKEETTFSNIWNGETNKETDPLGVSLGYIKAIPENDFTQQSLTYILVPLPNALLIVHQQMAHERIVYERLSNSLENKQLVAQKSLFPVTVSFGSNDFSIVQGLLPELTELGFRLEETEDSSFLILGTPADVATGNEEGSLELLLEQYKHFNNSVQLSKREKLIRCRSRQQAVKAGKPLIKEEMKSLVENLFITSTPNVSPSGSPTYTLLSKDFLDNVFSNMG